MASREELVKSAGSTGLDMDRTANRGYLIPPNRIADPSLLIKEQQTVLEASEKFGKRRSVVRVRAPKATLKKMSSQMEIESALPIVNGEKDDYIVTFGQNKYIKDEMKVREQIQLKFQRKRVEKTALERVDTLKKNNFYLSNKLTKDDAIDLMRLWWVFGWTWNGINDFIDLYNSNPDAPWFSAVRNQSGKIIGAVQGDVIEFGNHLSIEVTEFSTLPKYENMGVCTAALAGLLAQIISQTIYKPEGFSDKNPKNLPVLIYSELNIDSHSTDVAMSLGFTTPDVEINGVKIPQMLLENVFVLEKRKELEKLWLKYTDQKQKELLADPNFYEEHLRNFTVMTLTNETISQLFNFYEIEHILSSYL